MNCILRKAVPADTSRINELFVEMLNTIYSIHDAQGYEDGYLERFFRDRDDWICVAEHEKEIIAFLSIEAYKDMDYLYLDDFSVTEEYRSRGIGAALIVAAEEYAKKIGISQVTLHVEKTNTDAYRFYLRHGYQDHTDEGHRILMCKSVIRECRQSD